MVHGGQLASRTGVLKQAAHCNDLERFRKCWYVGSFLRDWFNWSGMWHVSKLPGKFYYSAKCDNHQSIVLAKKCKFLGLTKNPRLYKQAQGRPPPKMAPGDTCLLELTYFCVPLCPIAHKELSPAISHMNKFGSRLFPSQVFRWDLCPAQHLGYSLMRDPNTGSSWAMSGSQAHRSSEIINVPCSNLLNIG